MSPTLITFDAGQVLVELDLDFLARRLGERGLTVAPAALVAAAPAAWDHHDELVKAGARHPWHALMTRLLEGAGVAEPDPHVDWLWSEQPTANLWRKPIAGVIEIARGLARQGHRLGVLSNSEGRIAELLAEVGIADPFRAIVDSGRLPFAKPDRQIFDHTRRLALGVHELDAPTPIHVGDSWEADVGGARNAGWRAIWYGAHAHDHAPAHPHPGRSPDDAADPDVAIARDPAELRAALDRWLGE